MFLVHTNPKLSISVIAINVKLRKITNPRKKQLKVEILHNIKNFERIFKFYLFFFLNLS